jgi:tripartite-type tricarboxylate transporter receptor subunit TctC
LKIMANIDFKIVQFKGGGSAVTDLLGGHSDAQLLAVTTAQPYIKSGKLRALGVVESKRSVILPDVPPFAEAGVPGYEIVQWFGILAPAGTPAPVVERLNKELKTILTSDEAKDIFLKQGTELDYLGASEFRTFLEQELAKWAQVVKKANIKLQ